MNEASRTIAIVGRSGQVARALADRLAGAGHAVRIVARPDVDLLDGPSVHRAIVALRPDIVINAAAYTAVDRAEDEPDIANAINADGAGVVAAAAAEAGAPVIHFLTDYVFDGSKASAYSEDDACAPLGVYGRSKLSGETLVAAANPRHVILRTAWVCSPHGANFLKTMLRLAAERPELSVVDDQYGSPTFADDLAVAATQLVPRLLEPNARADRFGILHAVNGGETTWCKFARAIMTGAAKRGAPAVPVLAITTRDYPTKARRPARSLLSTDKLRNVHGISMRPWDVALEDCLDVLLDPRRLNSGRIDAHSGR